MTPGSVGPLSRPIAIGRIPPDGMEIEVVANESERSALAVDLDVPAIHDLRAALRLSGTTRRVRVEGQVRATVDRICVVTLETFTTKVEEDLEVVFETPPTDTRPRREDADAEIEVDLDGPDELIGDRIDLGSIVAEFLALGLDPYPRKPGVHFDPPPETDNASPFAQLLSLAPREPKKPT